MKRSTWLMPILLIGAWPIQAEMVPLAALGPEGLTVSGVVVRTDGHALWLGDGTSEVQVRVKRLVAIEPALVPGEQVTVTGEYRRGRLEARRLERGDGQVYGRAPRDRHDSDKDRRRSGTVGGPRGGRLVLSGEEADDIPPQLPPSALTELLEAAGYRSPGRIELHPRHYAVEVVNPWNERVEVHLDFDRRIYKERRLPD